MITNLILKNFTVFNDLSIDFSAKINVIIGENGTGKSHLLKAAYALCSANNGLNGQEDVSDKEIKEAVTNKLLNVFLPPDRKLGKMRKIGVAEDASMRASFVSDKGIALKFRSNSKSVTVVEKRDDERDRMREIYIKKKELQKLKRGEGKKEEEENVVKEKKEERKVDKEEKQVKDGGEEKREKEEG